MPALTGGKKGEKYGSAGVFTADFVGMRSELDLVAPFTRSKNNPVANDFIGVSYALEGFGNDWDGAAWASSIGARKANLSGSPRGPVARNIEAEDVLGSGSKTGQPEPRSGRLSVSSASAATNVASLRALIAAEFGADRVELLERAGVLRLSAAPPAGTPSNAAGASANGRIDLFAGNNAPGSVAVAYHEALHATLQESIGKPAFDALMVRLGRIEANAKDGSAVNKFFAKAADRIPDGTPAKDRSEELACYAVEEYQRAKESMPSSISGWAKDFIATLRAGLAKALGAAGILPKDQAALLADPATLSAHLCTR